MGFWAVKGEWDLEAFEAPRRAMAAFAMFGAPPPWAVFTDRGLRGVLTPDRGGAAFDVDGWSSDGREGSDGN